MKSLSFVLFAVFMCVSTAHAQKWVGLAEFPELTEELLGTSAGDRLYVIGGATPGPKDTAVPLPGLRWSLGTIEAYDPATNPWHQRSAMPTPRNHATAGLVNGKIYGSAIHAMLQSRNYEEPSLLFNRLGNGIGAPA